MPCHKGMGFHSCKAVAKGRVGTVIDHNFQIRLDSEIDYNRYLWKNVMAVIEKAGGRESGERRMQFDFLKSVVNSSQTLNGPILAT